MTDGALQGKAAIVTGAASGIGRAVARRLEAEGMDVLAVDLRPDPDGPGTPYQADLTDATANEQAVAAARERFGRVDVVVANAGIQHVSPIEEFPVEKWNTIVALLLTSPFLLARYSWPDLKASGAGRFIAIASVHGLVASPFKIAYISAKHGVVGMCKTLALEGAEHGITANAVCPAYVRTPLVEKQIADQARVHGISAERVVEEIMLTEPAIKRLIEPSEVAELVAYLCSAPASFANGSSWVLDGGWSAR